MAAALVAIADILTLGWKVFLLYKEAKDKGWVEGGRTLSQKIQEAKSDEQRAKLARTLFDSRAH